MFNLLFCIPVAHGPSVLYLPGQHNHSRDAYNLPESNDDHYNWKDSSLQSDNEYSPNLDGSTQPIGNSDHDDKENSNLQTGTTGCQAMQPDDEC